MEVIVSSAVADDEPELVAARRRGLRVRHRADVLAEIVASGRRHLRGRRARQDEHERADRLRARSSAARTRRSWSAAPCRSSASNARVGRGRHVVAEADESDGSLARLRPRAAVVLNAELDHHDHFGSLDDLHALFRGWVSELPPEGALVLHDSLDYPSPAELRRFGAGPGEGWRALDVAPDGEGTRFVLAAPGPRRAAAASWACPARTTRSTRPPRWPCSTGPGSAPSAQRRRLRPSAARPGATSAGARWPASAWSTTTRTTRASSRRRSRRRAARPGRDACWPASSRTCRGARACSPTASPRRCASPTPPACATSTWRAAPPSPT